jgi:hypothetical protein
VTDLPRHGAGDPRIPWVVLLDVPLGERPDAREVESRLAALDLGGRLVHGTRRELLGTLAADGSATLRAGLYDDGLVLAARHDALDGLAMLTVAGRLLGENLSSSARGIGSARPADRGALVRRAWEVAARPPARVAASLKGTASGDSFATITVQATPRTADLVLAGARAIVAWNREHGRPARRVSVAVGVSTLGGDAAELADHSAFLRLTGVERLGAEELRDRLAQAPAQPGGGGSAQSALAGQVLRLAATRLGSTLLVSHLGTIDTDRVPPAFYPVTGGGSGLSLGAASARGRSTLTLRARAAQHRDEDLSRLLELVVGALDQAV